MYCTWKNTKCRKSKTIISRLKNRPTEVQMVILWCWTGLNLNWFKSYDTKCKYIHFSCFAILWKTTNLRSVYCNSCVFCIFLCFSLCVITFEPIKILTCSAPQNDHLNLSFVKYIHVVAKKMTWNGGKMGICQSQILVISLYYEKSNCK